MKERTKYTKEFKIAAVRRWEEVRNFNEVGRELGISSSVIRNWKNQLQEEGECLNGCSLRPLTSSQRLIVTDNTQKPHGISQDLSVILHATGYLESGSLGLKSVLVADGTADLFVKDVCVRDWDVAPAAVILNQVGGHLLMSDGTPFVFGGSFEKPDGFIVARDDVLMDRALRAFAEVKKSIDE